MANRGATIYGLVEVITLSTYSVTSYVVSVRTVTYMALTLVARVKVLMGSTMRLTNESIGIVVGSWRTLQAATRTIDVWNKVRDTLTVVVVVYFHVYGTSRYTSSQSMVIE